LNPDEIDGSLPAVCFVLRYFTPYYSGAGKRTQRIAEGLLARGGSVLVATTRLRETQPYEIINGIPVYRVLTWPKHDWAKSILVRYLEGLLENLTFALSILLRLCSLRHRYQVIYAVDLSLAAFPAWLLCRLLGKRFVVGSTLTGANDPWTLRKKRVIGRLLYLLVTKADRFISISPAISASYRACDLPERRLVEISHIVDVERFSPASPGERTLLRSKLGLPLDKVLVIYTGLIIPRKGVDRLIEVWGHVCRRVDSSKVYLVLVGPMRTEVQRQQVFISGLEQRISGLGIGGTITFVGEVENVNEYLKASDIFVFLSRREGLGVSVAEAMACALPCVTAYLEGISEFFFEQNGGDGFFINGEDDMLVAETIYELIQDEHLRKQVGTRARGRAVKLFAHGVILDKYEQLFLSLKSPL
jgi:glycosyltransferase involved in cell wall biosynthesis